MKCESCYADNAAWTAACLNCGRPVTPIELCDNGHILAPGERECAACPKQTWPEAPAWNGPPMLRGVLLLSGAQLDLPNNITRSWIELRDTGEMLGCGTRSPAAGGRRLQRGKHPDPGPPGWRSELPAPRRHRQAGLAGFARRRGTGRRFDVAALAGVPGAEAALIRSDRFDQRIRAARKILIAVGSPAVVVNRAK